MVIPTSETAVILRSGDHVDTERLFEEVCAEYPFGKVEQQVNGDIVLMAPTGMESSDRNAEVVMQLRQWAKKDGRGRVLESNALFIFPDQSKKGPDASWVYQEKVLALSRQERKEFPRLVPDFVIELKSPSDRFSDLQEKMNSYLQLGVALGWLIDPDKRQVFIYTDASLLRQFSMNLFLFTAQGRLPGLHWQWLIYGPVSTSKMTVWPDLPRFRFGPSGTGLQ